MIPGPVVIIASFGGLPVAGLWGAAVTTVDIVLPPILRRQRRNPSPQSFVQGAAAAIRDWLTAATAVVSLLLLFRFRPGNPLPVVATTVTGVLAYPVLQPVWVFVQ